MVLDLLHRRHAAAILLHSLLVVPAAFHASDSAAEPFIVRDQNPLLAGFGIPAPLPATLSPSRSTRAALAFSWSNSATIQTGTREQLVVDAESQEWRLLVDHAFTPDLSLRVQLPYRTVSSGSLDSFIEDWHETLGLPNGDRDALPRDALRIAYARDEAIRFDLRELDGGLGDASIEAGYQLHASEHSALAGWFSLKLPTGNTDDLRGSGAVDVALSLSGTRRLSPRWSADGQLSVTRVGAGEVLADLQRDVIWSGLLGVQVRTWRSLYIGMQLDAHSAAFDSDLGMLEEALILTLGGDYRFQSGWLLSLSISEDVQVEASPDVSFNFTVGKRFGKQAERNSAR